MRTLDRLDRERGLGAMPATGVGRRPRAVRPRFVGALLTVALVAVVVLVDPGDSIQSVRRAVGLSPARSLPAPEVVAAGGDYVFAMTQPGSQDPVGWDPCSTIEYAVNPTGEPVGGRDLVESAIQRTSAVTGLTFEDVGDSDRRPFTGSFVPLGGEDPVVIGWADELEFPGLAGSVAGLGGASAESGVTGRRYYVTGGVVLDTAHFNDSTIAQSPRVMEAVVLHEIAHVVGLGHVNEPMELMHASNGGQVGHGPGDLEGLARLGSLPCR